MVLVYPYLKKMPDFEKFGMTSQLRRAIISIPANIAEGAGRNSEKELKQFLHIALGSSYEAETLLLVCLDQNYLQAEETTKLLLELGFIQKQIHGFIKNLKS